MQVQDWGVCSVGCQCPRYGGHIRDFHPFFPGVLPPAHLRVKEVSINFRETKFVQDPTSNDLSVFKKWRPIDPTFVIPSEAPKWNP